MNQQYFSHTNTLERLLEISDLCVTLDMSLNESTAKPLALLKHVDLHIHPGEIVGLVGPSGCGKSMIAQSILGLTKENPQLKVTGKLLFKSKDLNTLNQDQLRRLRGNEISMIFQEPMAALNPLHTLEKQISEALLLHNKNFTAQEIRNQVLNLLEKVEIPNPSSKIKAYPHELSGGQRQRVMIAMAIANKPKLLIADEPTTALDVSIQKEIIQLLQTLRETEQMAILFISHDMSLVKYVCQRAYVMSAAKIVESGDSAQVFKHPKHPITQGLIADEPEGHGVEKPAELITLVETKQLKVWFPITQGVFKRTVGYVKAVDPIDLTINQGYTYGLVGESGSGKSTLAMALLSLLPYEGDVFIEGKALNQLSKKSLNALRRDFQIVFQDPFASLNPRMTVGEIIAEGLCVHAKALGITGKDKETQIEQTVIKTLQKVELDPETRHRYPHEFSGGQRQRIAIGRALILNPRCLVLDEPTSALDRSTQKQIIRLLKKLQQSLGMTYLFISHDLRVVQSICHEVWVMKDGALVEKNESQSLFEQPKHPYTQKLLDAAFFKI